MAKWLWLGVLPLLCYGSMEEDQVLRRFQAHLLLDDPRSALAEVERAWHERPDSLLLGKTLVHALSVNGWEESALELWHALSKRDPSLSSDRGLLEELAWGVLSKEMQSSQLSIRFGGLIGSFLSQDIRAVPVLLRMLRDSNASIRAVAVQMVGEYRDRVLQEEVERLFREEKSWNVRLQVIKTIGVLRKKHLAGELQECLQSEKTTYEEKIVAIEALLQMYDAITLPEWEQLSSSNRAGLRHLACRIALHLRLEGVGGTMLRLLNDPHPAVRVAAVQAVGLWYRHHLPQEEVLGALEERMQERNPHVAISATWAVHLLDKEKAAGYFRRWILDGMAEHRRLAAAALACVGEGGVELAQELLDSSKDLYVKMNLALGLLGQRVEVEKSRSVLHLGLSHERKAWMWMEEAPTWFRVLSPSRVRYVEHIPKYPEVIDQMTRLEVLSFLAIVEDPDALGAIRQFLQTHSWGITGVAAATLLQEGDSSAIEVVRELLQDKDPHVRLQAGFILAMLGKDPSAIGELQKAYPSLDHDKKLHVLEAMGRVGSLETFHFLLGALQEPFPILRIAAAAALLQSVNR